MYVHPIWHAHVARASNVQIYLDWHLRICTRR
jgi:hypothetical protein